MKLNREHAPGRQGNPQTGPSEEEIQKAAYHLWLESGCKEGCEIDNWFAAKERLLHRRGRAGKYSPRSPNELPGSQPSR